MRYRPPFRKRPSPRTARSRGMLLRGGAPLREETPLRFALLLRGATLPLLLASVVGLVAAGCSGGGKDETTPSSRSPQRNAQDTDTAAAPLRSVDPATTGTLTGTVRVEGKVPPPGRVKMSGDAWCVRQHAGGVEDRSLVVHDGLLANAFVYIRDGLEGYRFDPPAQAVTLDQEGCLFSPRVVGVQVGQNLTLLNSDPLLHNVHAKARRNRAKNVALPRRGDRRNYTLREAEVMIPVICDVHPWMRAYIGVVAHPYFAVTDEDGRFTLENVPPGTYTVEAWHETLGRSEVSVTLPPSQKVEMAPLVFTMP